MASGKVLWACVLAGVAAVASGCGSGAKSTPANCDQVQPCGGDVVGTWKVAGACANAAQEMIELQSTATCAGEVLDGAALNVSGSVTFNADLSYTISSWQKSAVLAETAPLSCLPASSCASVSAGAGATAQFTCVDASGGKCNCTLISGHVLGRRRHLRDLRRDRQPDGRAVGRLLSLLRGGTAAAPSHRQH